MGSRGRHSLAALMVVENPLEIIQRPDAPYDLSDEQAEEWCAIVKTMPADHFMRGNYPLLAQYCRHIVSARRISQMIEECASRPMLDLSMQAVSVRTLAGLLALQKSESEAMNRLARSMRLTQQSVMKAETTKHPKNKFSKTPWQKDDD